MKRQLKNKRLEKGTENIKKGTGKIAGRRYAQLKCINRNPPVPNMKEG